MPRPSAQTDFSRIVSTVELLSRQLTQAQSNKRVAPVRSIGAVRLETTLSAYAKHVRRMRSDARAHLPADLFGDPAFDMLLDLFIAREENYKLSISSVVTAGHTPPTTGLRWLAKIEKYGLVIREPDPLDARRSYIILNESGRSMMKEWLSRHVSVPEEER